MTRSPIRRLVPALVLALPLSAVSMARAVDEPHRSPIALALTRDGTRLLTANQTAGSVSLIDTAGRKLLAEVATGDRPAGVAVTADGRRAVVAHWYGYDLAILDIQADRLAVIGRVEVGPEPRGVAISDDGGTAYVAVGVADQVVRVDLDRKQVTGRLDVGRGPRGLATSPDGRKLVVGNSRGQSLSLIDLAGWTVERTLPIESDNIRQVAITADGQTAYTVSMRNRGFATTRRNIELGWVLGQRLDRVSLTGTEGFETLTLDKLGEATSDAHGVAVSHDGRHIAVSCGGSHEIIFFRTDLKRLPWRPNSSRDLLPAELQGGDGRFRRLSLGGRPTELAFGPDGKTLYVANYLGDSVQVVDADGAALEATIPLGSPATLSLERRGEVLFHDGQRSFNQWYSCNTCHGDGHTGGLNFDTTNDGRQETGPVHERSRKKTPTLRRVAQTGPWTWHGWQTSLDDAMVVSFTQSMRGPQPSADDLRAIVAFLGTLDYPRNPNVGPDGQLSESAERGREVFRSPRAACNTCHGGRELTDGKVHDVGLGEPEDVYKGHNPPSLRGLYDKGPYLHDGRAKTLRDVLTGDHAPDKLNGLGDLTDQELSDLIEYLKAL